MVKIRKKTSKRTSSHMVAKVKKKVADKHRKDKKMAKKDVTWKSNKPKDIGIPNSFPYKDQILAEAAAEKQRAEEEKIARREAQRNGTGSATLASTAALAAALAADSASRDLFDTEMDEDDVDAEEKEVMDASVKLHAKSLRKVLEASDVIVEVLDARDPVGTRCRAVERELKSLDGGRKKLVLVLNKIDLVPAQVVQSWLEYLRTQAPTIPFKSSTQEQRRNLSASSVHTPTSASGSSTKPLMELIKGFRLSSTPASDGPSGSGNVKQSLTIGLIGHPNVGKSSLINTLKRSKACSVAPTPGWTKDVQEVVLEKGVRVLDCPGVVVEARGATEGVLRGMVKVEDVKDPKAPVEMILQRCKREHLQMLYNIPAFGDSVVSFLMEVARAKGRLRKGGVPDLDGTARSIIRDWVAGRIAYYTSPPSTSSIATAKETASAAAAPLTALSETDVGSSTLLTEFAPAFDLAALFGEADAVAFGDEGAAGSAIAGKTGVKLKEGFAMESDDADVGWIAGAEEEEEEDDMEADDDDMGADVDDLLDDENLDDNEDAEMEAAEVPAAPAPVSKAGKKRSAPQIVSVAPPASKKVKATKSVSFSSKPLGPTGSSSAAAAASPSIANATTQHTQQIANEVESIALNSTKAKKQAKKDKKRAVKALLADSVDDGVVDRDELIAKPRKARMVAGGGMNVDEAYNFEEYFPTAGGKPMAAAAAAADESEEEL